MTLEERPLHEIVEKLEAAWNTSDSAAWAALFAEDADFIHILGGHYNGRADIEHGHRVIFDTIYKGSRNKLTVQKVRMLRPDVALVFLLAELKWHLAGAEQKLQSRPTLAAQRKDTGPWEIVAFQNTVVSGTAPAADVVRRLAEEHPFKPETKRTTDS